MSAFPRTLSHEVNPRVLADLAKGTTMSRAESLLNVLDHRCLLVE